MNDGMKLVGADILQKELKAFGPTVGKKGGQKGVRKGAQMLRRELRRAAPKRSGTLRKALQIKVSRRNPIAWVGLRKIKGEPKGRWYYRTLEFGREGGQPLHPFFEKAAENVSQSVAQTIVSEARKALYEEAGKVLARTRFRR